MTAAARPLLDHDDGSPVGLCNPQGSSPVLLIGDHAGRAIPARLGQLGLAEPDLERHIAWDIGVRGLGEWLAQRLDAVFLHQCFSRLVIDCNRAPASEEAMPEVSDGTIIPGNQALSPNDRMDRVTLIHEVYHHAIAAEIARRQSANIPTILISLHSFTPVMDGRAREWNIGVLHDGRRDEFALALLARLQAEPGLIIGDNQPYQMDATDYSVPRHAFTNGLAYAELEVRQDLIASSAGQREWGQVLASALEHALAGMGVSVSPGP